MTWSWVASAVFASGLAGGQTNFRSVTPLDKIAESLLTVQLPGQSKAMSHAVLIQESGLFLLATGSVKIEKLTGKAKGGTRCQRQRRRHWTDHDSVAPVGGLR